MQTQYPIKVKTNLGMFTFFYHTFIVWTNIQHLNQYLTVPLVAITTSSHLGYEYTGFAHLDLGIFWHFSLQIKSYQVWWGLLVKDHLVLGFNSEVWLECLCGILPDLYTPNVSLDCFWFLCSKGSPFDVLIWFNLICNCIMLCLSMCVWWWSGINPHLRGAGVCSPLFISSFHETYSWRVCTAH